LRVLPLRQFDVLPPHVSAVPFQMAIFIQLLWRRKTKTSNMLPPVAAVLPAEKGDETLVKWGLLPCCRFSGPLSINLAFYRAFPARPVPWGFRNFHTFPNDFSAESLALMGQPSFGVRGGIGR